VEMDAVMDAVILAATVKTTATDKAIDNRHLIPQ